MCLRLAVLLVSFLVCVLSDRTPCEHQCFPYRIKCHSDCRRDYLSNSFKEKFKACSEKCEWYFNDCDDECECRAINVRERAGCEQICQTHPYLDEWNRRQCMIECKFDFSENYSKCWYIFQIWKCWYMDSIRICYSVRTSGAPPSHVKFLCFKLKSFMARKN